MIEETTLNRTEAEDVGGAPGGDDVLEDFVPCRPARISRAFIRRDIKSCCLLFLDGAMLELLSEIDADGSGSGWSTAPNYESRALRKNDMYEFVRIRACHTSLSFYLECLL